MASHPAMASYPGVSLRVLSGSYEGCLPDPRRWPLAPMIAQIVQEQVADHDQVGDATPRSEEMSTADEYSNPSDRERLREAVTGQ